MLDLRTTLRTGFVLACGTALTGAATMDITPVLNNSPISRVTYDVGGSTVIQNSEAAGVSNTADTPVLLKGITTGGTDLTFFNVSQAKVVNVNPALAGTANVGVFNGGTTTSSASPVAYANAMAATSMDTNIRNYGFHDLDPLQAYPSGADSDLLFGKALNPADFLVVSERWGNSSFQLLALAADGNPIVGGNLLKLGASATYVQIGYTVHDWNTGYSSQSNVPSQAQALTLFSVGKFFEGTVTPQQAVFGLRIFSSDGADLKLLGVSSDTFDNNPDNPLVPEPSSLLLVTGVLAFGYVCKRSRTAP